jgi:hypothetical protein
LARSGGTLFGTLLGTVGTHANGTPFGTVGTHANGTPFGTLYGTVGTHANGTPFGTVGTLLMARLSWAWARPETTCRHAPNRPRLSKIRITSLPAPARSIVALPTAAPHFRNGANNLCGKYQVVLDTTLFSYHRFWHLIGEVFSRRSGDGEARQSCTICEATAGVRMRTKLVVRTPNTSGRCVAASMGTMSDRPYAARWQRSRIYSETVPKVVAPLLLCRLQGTMDSD